MNLNVTADARATRRELGVVAWAVLEELALDARVDAGGALVARSNVRQLAAHLGVSKDTTARAVKRLTHEAVVLRVIAGRGAGGALPTSSYILDLTRVAGLTVDTSPDAQPQRRPASRPRTSPASRINDAQSSLFDLPANAS